MLLFHEGGNKSLAQDPKGALVAEEASHVDEQIVEELLHFLRVIAQKSGIFAEPLNPMQRHPARDPPLQSRLLVSGKIDSGMPLQGKKNAAQVVQVLGFSLERFDPLSRRLSDVRVSGDPLQFGGNFFR